MGLIFALRTPSDDMANTDLGSDSSVPAPAKHEDQSEDTRPPVSDEPEEPSGDSLLADALDAGGVWNGMDDSDSYMYTVGLEGDSQSGYEGLVHAWRQDRPQRGSWEATAEVVDGTLVVTPGDWVQRPKSWTRDELLLDLGESGSLYGTATPEGDSEALTVQLDRIADGPPDSESVAQDWRVALVTADDEALEMLEQLRQDGAAQRDNISGSWVPQVASGCVGLDSGSVPMTASWILSKHSREAQDHGAITVSSEDLTTKQSPLCPGENMWILLVPETAGSSKKANAWCDDQGYDADNCAARYVPPRGQSGTKVEWR